MRRSLFLLLAAASLLAAEQVTIQVLATTDLHGNLMPYDYFTARDSPRGLAKIATLIRELRQQNANTILLDCGDTIQGAPLESYHQAHALEPGARPDPMMLAMNALGYDAMTLGNHEFNYGLANLDRARTAARFPWLSANTLVRSGSGVKPFDPYVVRTVAGVKVALIGITTPGIPHWEKKENYDGYSWMDGFKAALSTVEMLREKEHPDVVVLAIHAGMERDPATGESRRGGLAGEDMVYRVAQEVPGVDAIVYGHSHQTQDAAVVGQTMVIQPKNWGGSLARLTFTLEREAPSAGWKRTSRTGKLIPVTRDTAADQEIEAIAKPYHEAAEAWLNGEVTRTPKPMDASRSRVEDTAIIDAIQEVQMHYAGADVSFASAFNPRARIAQGAVTVRQIAALYVYDNELYAIEGNGRMVRQALENASRFFKTCPTPECSTGPLLNSHFFGYNFDMAEGVTYELDLSKPEGSRVQNLRFKGQPLTDAQPLRIAINNYRYAGSSGYTMFGDAKIVWRSYRDIRDLMIEYYSEGHPLPAQADGNWRIVPASAVAKLEEEMRADSARNAGK